MHRSPTPIVSVSWLKEHLYQDNLIILNCTIQKVTSNGEDDFKLKFIENSVFFDIKKEFSEANVPFPNTMLSAKEFEQKARQLGVNNDSYIVVYDDYGLYSAARVWWMFKTMGFNNIAVLDGGSIEWIKSGNEVYDEPFKKKVQGDFTANYIEGLIHNHIPVLQAIEDDSIEVLDARSNDRFLGLTEEPREGVRSGHIPNSKSLPYSSLLNNHKLKPINELNDLFESFSNKKMIFSCGTGITACVLALGAELAGNNNISVYDGSWTEWGSLHELPIEN